MTSRTLVPGSCHNGRRDTPRAWRSTRGTRRRRGLRPPLEKTVQGVATAFPTNSNRSDFNDFSFKDTMCSGMAPLRYAYCLGNSDHAESDRTLLPIWTLFRCQNAQEIVRYLILQVIHLPVNPARRTKEKACTHQMGTGYEAVTK